MVGRIGIIGLVWLLALRATAAEAVLRAVPGGGGGPGAVVMPAEIPPEVLKAMQAAGGGPPGRPDKGDKDKDKDKSKDGGKDSSKDDKKDDTRKPLERPTKPAKPANPDELKLRPGPDGKVKFNFSGQAWPDVLQWLADISGMSLDWQELPSDYLNLTTQNSYTVDEVRDLLNRHLLARGYTILRQGEVLSVVNLKKLDPALVPRVAAADLDRRDRHEFVRVSFALDWMPAEQAAEELKPMLSPFGKLTPLPATNRLEALDAVANLLGIRTLLAEEQSDDGPERLVREFRLNYARADDVLQQLQTLLGLDTKAGGSSGGPGGRGSGGPSPEQMQQMMQQMQQQMQQQQGGGDKGKAPPAKSKSEIRLVANQRRNSVVAHAPADKMAIIAQAVKTLDVAGGQEASLPASIARTQVYRLVSLDPEPLVKTLEEVGNLSPYTRIQLDRANKSIIVHGPLADQVAIRAILDKLDGTGRKFEVLPLRRLAADYVAGTVAFMMTGAGKEKPQQRRSFWDYGPPRSQPEEKPNEFRCDADIEHNRLLLWANELEIAEVQNLLVKLGELPPEGGNPSTVRTLDIPSGKEADEFLQRLRRAWSQVSPNPLVIPPPVETPKPATEFDAPQEPPRPVEKKSQSTGERTLGPTQRSTLHAPGRPTVLARWAVAEAAEAPAQSPPGAAAPVPAAAAAPAAKSENRPGPPPITITRGPDGRLVISSPDAKALDQLEELIAALDPPGKADYKVYRLRYVWAAGLASMLRDLFKDDDKDSKRRMPFFFFDYPGDSDSKSPVRLSHRRPLKILSESDTNSIIVQGADAGQLKKIEEIIEYYDKPEPTDARSVRVTKPFTLKYAKVKLVADAIKDVYRDLLSANDKALQSGDKKGPERSYTYIFDAGDSSEQKTPKFKGLLSIGIDDASNTMIVSAPAFLFEDVGRLIEDMDQAARPTFTKVEVMKLNPGSSATQVHEALSRLYGGGGKSHADKPQPKPEPAAKPGRPGAKTAPGGGAAAQ